MDVDKTSPAFIPIAMDATDPTTTQGLWPHLPADRRYGNCIDELLRIEGFQECLRDSIEHFAQRHDESFATRLWVCDYVCERLRCIAATLEVISEEACPVARRTRVHRTARS